MRRNLFYIGVIFTLLSVLAATPISVRAEGDPPPAPEPVKPPWITGVNPNLSVSAEEQTELTPSGVITSWQEVEVSLMTAPPGYVDLAPLSGQDASPGTMILAVPQLYQDPSDVTCGAAALSMALDFLSLNGGGEAPSQAALISDLKEAGLLYETGTGVEELAYLARQHGYQGTSAFHDWTLAQLKEQLEVGMPVVVSLGLNGEGQPGHFVALTGISGDGQRVSYNDPVLGKRTVTTEEFLGAWSWQGNSGLVVQKEPLAAVDDPLLPWMGLFSALAALAVIAKQVPLGSELTGTIAGVRRALADPRRKGLGGAFQVEGSNPDAPPYIAPPGYSWKKKLITKYGWKDVEITEKVEVPNIVRTYGVVRYRRWVETVPVYKIVKVDRGDWAYRTVKKYRTERYRTKQRYRVEKTYWYRRDGRLCRGSYYTWKTRTVVKTRRVPYTESEKYWVPKIVEEQRFVRFREIEHHDPVYGWKEEERGTRTVEQTRTTRAWKPVGTDIKWVLKKDPISTPTVTSTSNPCPTPTPSPIPVPTPISTPLPFPASDSRPNFTHDLINKVTDVADLVTDMVNEKVIEPIRKTVFNPTWWVDRISNSPKPSFYKQKVLSLSAGKEWDIKLFSQEGIIAQSYSPPNILSLIYAEQKLNIDPKIKITSNPGSLLDIDITSGTCTLKLSEKVSLYSSLKGGGTALGVGIKEPSKQYDYEVRKHFYSATWRGLTHIYRQEGVDIREDLSNTELESKLITSLKCESQTIKTEGILAVVGITALIVSGLGEAGAALAPLVPAMISIVEKILSGLSPLLNPISSP